MWEPFACILKSYRSSSMSLFRWEGHAGGVPEQEILIALRSRSWLGPLAT